jgi:5-methylcytosine-specific restriction endonuclease McrA
MTHVIVLKDRAPKYSKKTADWREILIARDGLDCYWCGRLCNPDLSPNADLFPTRDHLIRRADGGKDNLKNQVIACRKCNSSRHVPGWEPKYEKVREQISPEIQNLFRDAGPCRK